MSNPSLSLTNTTGASSPSSVDPLLQPHHSGFDIDPCHITTIFNNLSTIGSQMESLQAFLSLSTSSHVIVSSHQMQMVSTAISTALGQLIENSTALLAICQYPDHSNSLSQLSTEMDHNLADEQISENFIFAEIDEDMTKIASADDNPPDGKFSIKFIRSGKNNEDATKVTTEGENPQDEKSANKLIREYNDVTEVTIEGNKCEVIELGAAQILGDRKHYCRYCAKGFKRYSNMRTHIRSHKESRLEGDKIVLNARFSCPILGCDRNKLHKSFKPLKSVVCVKNHYRRCHCPKMYLCPRCHTKNFSLLADLKMHMKQCGEILFKCSCGTSFSRRAKLLRHVALFKGHKAMDMKKCDHLDKGEGGGEMSPTVEEEDGKTGNFSDDEFFEGLLQNFDPYEKTYCFQELDLDSNYRYLEENQNTIDGI